MSLCKLFERHFQFRLYIGGWEGTGFLALFGGGRQWALHFTCLPHHSSYNSSILYIYLSHLAYVYIYKGQCYPLCDSVPHLPLFARATGHVVVVHWDRRRRHARLAVCATCAPLGLPTHPRYSQFLCCAAVWQTGSGTLFLLPSRQKLLLWDILFGWEVLWVVVVCLVVWGQGGGGWAFPVGCLAAQKTG